MEGVDRITKRRRKVRNLGEPHPWEPRHMKLSAVRFAETVGEPWSRRNLALGVVQHLWRSPVPFVGFYPPEGVSVTEQRVYVPTSPRHVDDTEYLSGVEAHKRAFARDLEETMLPAGSLPGYFEVPTDEGWQLVLDLVEPRLELSDAWELSSSSRLDGDLAPFVWAYRNSGFCLVTLFDKDIGGLRDDLLFVAKREGVELRWSRKVA
ncbi:MAG: hypothetical protein H0V53_11535 [Rubrobacter sp.]|nr:hypothetical protein [Rubrobacter sp.]